MAGEQFGYLLVERLAQVHKDGMGVLNYVRSVLVRRLGERVCLSGTDDEDVRRLARQIVENPEVVRQAILEYYEADKAAGMACAEFLQTIREAGKALVAALDGRVTAPPEKSPE